MTEEGPYHWRIFCGPLVLKDEYMLHECTSADCPLHSRVIPRKLGTDELRMNALHTALDKREPSEKTIEAITSLAKLQPPEALSMMGSK